MRANITIERRYGVDVVMVALEYPNNQVVGTDDLLKEASRALQIEVMKNERTNPGNRPSR